jgi:protein-S-isoprenylcysteine O-methyltransferase Ste14
MTEMLSVTTFFQDPPTALDAINVSKSVLTGAIILFLGGKYGWTPRSTIYAGLHLSYLAWWMLEQALFPPFQNRFQVEIRSVDWIFILLIVGVCFALPAFNTFCRPPSPTPSTFVSLASIMMFTLGCLINTMADVQMHTTKTIQKGLVTDGVFRLCQSPNYFGDYLRYASFALISGRLSSFLVLACVIGSNLFTMKDPTLKGGMMDRYGEAYTSWIEQVPNKIIPQLPTGTLIIISTVTTIWALSYGLGLLVAKKQHKAKTL